MAAGISSEHNILESSQLYVQHSVPPVPTTNQIVAADYSGCCLECCLHRTTRTVVVHTEEKHA